MELLQTITDTDFHAAADGLYHHIMANGYRFNTNPGAVFLASLYQQDKNLAYDFLNKWEKQGEELTLSDAEKEHLAFALKATTVKRRITNATNKGIGEALKGRCGRREFLTLATTTLSLAAAAPLLGRLDRLFEGAEESPPTVPNEADSSQNENGRKQTEAHDWLQNVKETYGSEWLHYALGAVAGGGAVIAARRYLGQRDEKRDAILDDLAELCRSHRMQAQLPRETGPQR